MHTTIHTIKWTLTSACNHLAKRSADLISWNVHATLAHLQRPGSVAPYWNSRDYLCDRWRPNSTTMSWAMRAPLGRRAVQEGRWPPCRRLLARARCHLAQGCRNPGQAREDLQIIIAAIVILRMQLLFFFLTWVGRRAREKQTHGLVTCELEPQSDQLTAELGWPLVLMRYAHAKSTRRLRWLFPSRFIPHVIALHAYAALVNSNCITCQHHDTYTY